jgi:signal peptidase I
MSEKIKNEIRSWLFVIVIVLILRAVFVEAYVIPTGSMEKTLLIGDALMVNRFIYGVKIPIPFTKKQIPIIPGRFPQHGEIIAFQSPFENINLVKRCIAVEGDTVEIIDKVLYINGERIAEPFVRHRDRRIFRGVNYDSKLYQEKWEKSELGDKFRYHVRDNFGPVVVPKDHIFAMGDNRDDSMDSRFWGPLHVKYLLGKPLFIYFSFDPGGPAQTLFEILRIWRWKGMRLARIGKVL